MTIELNRGRTEAFAVPTLAPVQKVSVRPGADVDEDSVLVALCQQGDEGAFEDLVTRHRNSLYRLCLYRLGNRSDAEDAVQEAFIRAWRALPSFSGKRRFYPWLSVIAKNVCTDVQRKWGRCSPMTDQEFDLIVPPAEAEQDLMLEWRGEREILARAFNRLSERHREVLELREGRNWSYQQIAAFSGVEVSTVETLLFRARRSLKREFMTIARAEGALGVLLVPWYLLRRTLVRLASGARARRRPGLPPFGAKSASIGAEHPHRHRGRQGRPWRRSNDACRRLAALCLFALVLRALRVVALGLAATDWERTGCGGGGGDSGDVVRRRRPSGLGGGVCGSGLGFAGLDLTSRLSPPGGTSPGPDPRFEK